MGISPHDWKNKVGTADRSCKCGSWRAHWEKYSKSAWPSTCAVQGCHNPATLGGHVHHADVTGEKIIPMCPTCNAAWGSFSLKTTTIVSANRSNTCESGLGSGIIGGAIRR